LSKEALLSLFSQIIDQPKEVEFDFFGKKRALKSLEQFTVSAKD
jgi:hypothetical protein